MRRVFIIVWFIFNGMGLEAQTHQALAIANTLVEKGDLSAAITSYHDIINSGDISAELYFNVANTYLRMDSLAAAILYYEKARRISPGDEAILNNLEIARGRVEDQVTVLPEFFLIAAWNKTCYFLSANLWAMASIFFFLALAVMFYLIAYMGLNYRTKVMAVIITTLLFLFVLSLVAGYARKTMDTTEREAIVFKETFMKSGPDSRSDDLKLIHPGYKVFILDTLNGWTKIRTEDREEGWIEPDNFKVI